MPGFFIRDADYQLGLILRLLSQASHQMTTPQ